MTKRRDYQFWVPVIVVVAVMCAIIVGFMVASRPFDDASIGCKSHGILHTMSVQNGVITPEHIDVKYCDTLKIVNDTDGERTIMFGMQNDMTTYDGVREKTLASGRSFTVVLARVGDFHIHEHALSLEGTFTVK